MGLSRRLWLLVLAIVLVPLVALGAVVLLALILFAARAEADEAFAAFDQFANATCFGGWRVQTISGHAWSSAMAGKAWAGPVVAVLDALDPGHCQRAWQRDQPLIDFLRST